MLQRLDLMEEYALEAAAAVVDALECSLPSLCDALRWVAAHSNI